MRIDATSQPEESAALARHVILRERERSESRPKDRSPSKALMRLRLFVISLGVEAHCHRSPPSRPQPAPRPTRSACTTSVARSDGSATRSRRDRRVRAHGRLRLHRPRPTQSSRKPHRARRATTRRVTSKSRASRDTARVVTTRVDVDGRHATVLRNGQTSSVDLPADRVRDLAVHAGVAASRAAALLEGARIAGDARRRSRRTDEPGVDPASRASTRSASARASRRSDALRDRRRRVGNRVRVARRRRTSRDVHRRPPAGCRRRPCAPSSFRSSDELMTIAARAAMSDLAAISARTQADRRGKDRARRRDADRRQRRATRCATRR